MLEFPKSGRWPSEHEIYMWARDQRRIRTRAWLRRSFARMCAVLCAASTGIAERRRRLEVRRRLLAMDERLLADIGLERRDIEFLFARARMRRSAS